MCGAFTTPNRALGHSMLRDARSRATPADLFDTSIGVYARLRPGAGAAADVEVKRKAGEQRHIQVRNLEFSLDWVFDENAPQEDVFDRVAKERVARVLEGYNVCILAYGQTGSGKTHTMFGPEKVLSDWGGPHAELHGLAPRAIQALFDRVTVGSGTRVSCSYVEVYNDSVNDLLGARKGLPLREAAQGVVVDGLAMEEVASLQQTMAAVGRGNAARVVAGMKMNARSSRGHAVLTVQLETRCAGVDSTGTLVLVDLAGMERPRKSSPATLCIPGCNHVYPRLQPCVSQAATMCISGELEEVLLGRGGERQGGAPRRGAPHQREPVCAGLSRRATQQHGCRWPRPVPQLEADAAATALARRQLCGRFCGHAARRVTERR